MEDTEILKKKHQITQSDVLALDEAMDPAQEGLSADNWFLLYVT
jgi:hypothetical protein